MRIGPRSLTQITFAAVAGALLALPTTNAQAQPPRQMGGTQVTRARQACDVAAAQAGYRVMRRDRENVNGSTYQMPMHVSHGSNAERHHLQLRHAAQRRDRAALGRARGSQQRPLFARNDYTDRATRACENYINGRRGWHATQVGTPTQHGARQLDVPVTVRRNGRNEETVTCRYSTSNGKVSIH